MLIHFTKMQGLGNDFIVLDMTKQHFELSPEQIRSLGDRHFGVGFDQLLQIEPPSDSTVDFDYRIFNADGNEVEHCGNGARCFAIYVRQRGLSDKNPIRVKTIDGVLELKINNDDTVTVNMGIPRFEPAEIPFDDKEKTITYTRTLPETGENIEFSALSLGNPHAVLIVDDVEKADVHRVGKLLGSHPDFSRGVNVGFMEIVDPGSIKLRVFERGVGETLACGTGACAAVAAGRLRRLLGETVSASLIGGELSINWQSEEDPLLMTGPANTVFEGSIEL